MTISQILALIERSQFLVDKQEITEIALQKFASISF